MCSRRHWFLNLFILLFGLIVVMAATPRIAYGDEPHPKTNQGTCINCHENLYFLHDTGKWFCLRDAPMGCADCHGGDPTAPTKDQAHANRSAYPVVNENITKCQECHPAKSIERVRIFREVAGINHVTVAAAYVPAAISNPLSVSAIGQEQPATSHFVGVDHPLCPGCCACGGFDL